MPSRPAGRLLDLEYSILEVGLELHATGGEIYGFAIARHLAEQSGNSGLIGHGTLYKALARLVNMGLVESEWEDYSASESEGRPRRRLYRITGAGRAALATRPVAVVPVPFRAVIA
jgi:PadR family transcriptional regulator, regulatory protein PadR